MIAYDQTTPQERGLLRAVVEGIQVRHVQGSLYLASSISKPGEWHTVRDGACDCAGYQHTGYCKHVAAVALRALAEPRPCSHCGDTGKVERFVEHVGGKGEVDVYLCTDRSACWARWNQQNGL